MKSSTIGSVKYKKKEKKFSVGKLFLYILLITIGFFWIYPFLWMISASFKTQGEFFRSNISLLPQSLTLDNYIRAWENANFSVYFKNSIIVTICVVLIVLMTTALAGYVIGRYQFMGKKIIMSIFVASITIPLVFTIIPIYKMLSNIGLNKSLIGLILAESGGGHVIFLMLFSGFFESIPKEMEEAATIDGCNFPKTFFYVMFPLAKPIMVTVIIMQFIWTWNSFLLPLTLTLNNSNLRTLAVGLYALRGENIVDWTGIAAGASIAVVPVIVVFILCQKYFVEGISGAVKS